MGFSDCRGGTSHAEPVLGHRKPLLLQPGLWESPFPAACSSCWQPAVSPPPAHSPRTLEHVRSLRSDDSCIYQVMGSTSLQEKISPSCHVHPSPCELPAGPGVPSSFLCWAESTYLRRDPPVRTSQVSSAGLGPQVKPRLVAHRPQTRLPVTRQACWRLAQVPWWPVLGTSLGCWHSGVPGC